MKKSPTAYGFDWAKLFQTQLANHIRCKKQVDGPLPSKPKRRFPKEIRLTESE